MKQDIEVYLVDSFVDFAGKEHKFVAVALSESPVVGTHTLKIGWVDQNDNYDCYSTLNQDVYRMVTIGIAICNPDDEFNEEKGKRIARNKAANLENLPRLYAPAKGIITKELVDTFLKQQVQFFKENPGTLMAGYDDAKKDYEEIQEAITAIDNFTDDEKKVFNLAINDFDFSKYANLAKLYVRKVLKK